MQSNRRDFLSRASGAAAALGIFGSSALVLAPRKSRAQSSFPPFNQSAISPSTLSSFTSTFLGMANDVYNTGSTAPSNLTSAATIWGSLYGQLEESGFNSSMVTYINEGVPQADPQFQSLYNLLQQNGLQQSWTYFSQKMRVGQGYVNSLFTDNVEPPFNQYGVPDTNYGHQCAISHFASVSGASVAVPSGPVVKGSTGKGQIHPANHPIEGGGGGGGAPGGSEDFCFYMNGFLAYAGIMAIPLSLEGAACPPLGIGLGIGVAFASAFAFAFC